MNAIAEYQRHERRQSLVPERVEGPRPEVQSPTSPLTRQLSEGERVRLEACERVIRRGLDTFLEVGVALGEIRERKLYRQTHGTFEDYCRQKWEMTARRARQLMDATEVVRQLEDVKAVGNVSGATPETATGTVALPRTESQARPLVPLKEEHRRAAATRAAEIAGPGKQPTAKQFRAAAEEVRPWPAKQEATEATEKDPETLDEVLRKPQATKLDGMTIRQRCEEALLELQEVFAMIGGNPPLGPFNNAAYHLGCAETEFKRIAGREESPKTARREKAQTAQKQKGPRLLSCAARARLSALAEARKRVSAKVVRQGGAFIITKKLSQEAHYYTDYKGWNSIRGRGRKFSDSAEAAAMAAKVGGKVVRL